MLCRCKLESHSLFPLFQLTWFSSSLILHFIGTPDFHRKLLKILFYSFHFYHMIFFSSELILWLSSLTSNSILCYYESKSTIRSFDNLQFQVYALDIFYLMVMEIDRKKIATQTRIRRAFFKAIITLPSRSHITFNLK